MTTTCPICGRPHVTTDTTVSCDTCGYSIINGMFLECNQSELPHIRDSFELINNVLDGKVLMSYGKHQLFEPEFRLETTTVIPIDTRCAGNYPTDNMNVLISAGKALSKFYVQDLYNGIVLGTRINPTLRDNKTAASLMLQWMGYKTPHLSAANEQALSAYAAPTWFDVVCVLLYHSYKSITQMSESEIFYSVLSCNKAAIVQDFLSPSKVTQQLAQRIIDQAKFCVYNPHKALTPKASVNPYLTGSKFTKAVQAVIDSSPELITTADGMSQNNYMFGTAEYLTIENPLLRDVKDDAALEHMCMTAALFHKLWKTFGEPCSTANLQAYENAVLNKMKSLPVTTTERVLTFWNIVSSQLERKYT